MVCRGAVEREIVAADRKSIRRNLAPSWLSLTINSLKEPLQRTSRFVGSVTHADNDGVDRNGGL